MSDANVLSNIKQLEENENWKKLFDVCDDYLQSIENGYESSLESSELLEIHIRRIQAIIYMLDLSSLCSKEALEQNTTSCWADEYDDDANLLLNKSRYYVQEFCDTVGDLQDFFELLYMFARDKFLDKLDYYIEQIDWGNEGTLNAYSSYSLGYFALFCIIANIADMIIEEFDVDEDDLEYSNYFEEARIIESNKFYNRCVETCARISELTEDFPYVWDGESLIVLYNLATIFATYSLCDYIDDSLKLERMKTLVNLKCDELNVIGVRNGKGLSIIIDNELRRKKYNEILELQEKIRELEPNYSHPNVNIEAFKGRL